MRFQRQSDNTFVRYITCNNTTYKIVVPEDMWNTYNITNHTKYWIRKTKEGKNPVFKYGTVVETEYVPFYTDEYTHICDMCERKYKTRSGLLKHIRNHHSSSQSQADFSGNIQSPIINRTINNITNNTIQINVPIRNFTDENPMWLTRDLFMEVIHNIPSAIPRLIQEKHFNEKFPENRNIRIDNKRDIRKRLQVYDSGRWKLKDRPDVEFKIIVQMYDMLNDLIEMITDDNTDDEDDDDTSSLDKRIEYIARKIRASQFRSMRVRRMVREWKEFSRTLDDDFERTIAPFNDKLDTLLLDNELRIQQLEERRSQLDSV